MTNTKNKSTVNREESCSRHDVDLFTAKGRAMLACGAIVGAAGAAAGVAGSAAGVVDAAAAAGSVVPAALGAPADGDVVAKVDKMVGRVSEGVSAFNCSGRMGVAGVVEAAAVVVVGVGDMTVVSGDARGVAEMKLREAPAGMVKGEVSGEPAATGDEAPAAARGRVGTSSAMTAPHVSHL